jgi:N utilization substance protein A
MLTGYNIDVYRDIDTGAEEDVFLDDFSDEIDQWVIDALKGIGCATAKAVLAADPAMLAEKADLEEDTIAEVRRVLSREFEDVDNVPGEPGDDNN